jgi:hypothetical protein
VNSVEKPSSLILQSTMVSESAKTKLSGTSLRCAIPQLQYCEEWNDAKREDCGDISPVVDHLCAEPSGLNL